LSSHASAEAVVCPVCSLVLWCRFGASLPLEDCLGAFGIYCIIYTDCTSHTDCTRTCFSISVPVWVRNWQMVITLILHRHHSGSVVSAVASQQQEGVHEFACSPRVSVGFLHVLQFPLQSKDMQVR